MMTTYVCNFVVLSSFNLTLNCRTLFPGHFRGVMLMQVPAHVPYAGRQPSASPATGFSDVHKREQDELCTNAMNLEYAL